MDSQRLEQLGLSSSEAQVYLALVHLGSSQAGSIAKKAELNRTTTYDALKRLQERGFVTHSLVSGTRVYKSTSPESFAAFFEEQAMVAKELSEELTEVYQEQKEVFEIYEGRKGIRSILHDLLNYGEYVAFGSSGKFLEVMKHDFVLFQKQKKDRGIQSRVLQTEVDSQLADVAYAEFRFMPQEESSPTTTIVYGETVAILIWGITPHAVIIQSRPVAKQYLRHFEMLWHQAQKT